ncbi:MAG: DUF3261 domain-containing protein [Desulfovibrionaceae bacterium]|nr:DUF3261 domain-containing protein [Desulfovibrionaceae bacterium]
MRHALAAWILILILPCVAPSCAGRPETASLSPAYIAEGAPYLLLPPEELERPMDMAQQMEGRGGGRDFVLQAWVQADEREIRMVWLNALGAEIGRLIFQSSGLELSSAFLPAGLLPEYIVADFQLCFYRIAALERALGNAGLALRAESPASLDGVERRVIFQGEKKIIVIEKSPGRIRFENLARGYAYTLRGDF